MSRNLKFIILLGAYGAALAGCGGHGTLNGGGGTPPGTAPVVLMMTDTPPANVSILSAQVTLTGATLNPGNVPVFSGSTTIELTRLQTDIAYITTAKVAPGSYTSLALTFSNPKLTIENDTGTTLATTCVTGTICAIQPVATNLSTTITLSPAVTVSATTGAGLLVDVNLNNVISATLGADFTGVTVSEFVPGSTGTPLLEAEDVVGTVVSIDATNSKFSLQNSVGTVSLLVDTSSTFLNFPAGTCATFSIACVQANQILSVDITVRFDGTAVARNVLFEDPNASDIDVEGIITSITSLGSSTFNMVTLAESTTIPSLPIGSVTTVTFTGSTLSDIDLIHVDSTAITSSFPFSISVASDLMVGQQVQVRRNPASSGTTIAADRVRLRSSRVNGTYQTGPSTLFTLGTLPSLFIVHGVQTIQAQTATGSVSAICTGISIGIGGSCSSLVINHSESVRGPLFPNSGNPTVVATTVIQH